ncbi:uncharacterized protein LOC129742275 [Uranotaenia lowii]|uniref:uncharacterized protein LOC129742275 n=1 Tax=Uranotaenia lowii TaxID=190385 RepID=UPI0024785FCA|nr:uncharacterized protein LOC129742275 [Uranotaenia lowii]
MLACGSETGRTRLSSNNKVTINGVELEIVEDFDYLGSLCVPTKKIGKRRAFTHRARACANCVAVQATTLFRPTATSRRRSQSQQITAAGFRQLQPAGCPTSPATARTSAAPTSTFAVGVPLHLLSVSNNITSSIDSNTNTRSRRGLSQATERETQRRPGRTWHCHCNRAAGGTFF